MKQIKEIKNMLRGVFSEHFKSMQDTLKVEKISPIRHFVYGSWVPKNLDDIDHLLFVFHSFLIRRATNANRDLKRFTAINESYQQIRKRNNKGNK